MILVLRVPKTIVRFSGSLEGLREQRKSCIIYVYDLMSLEILDPSVILFWAERILWGTRRAGGVSLFAPWIIVVGVP